jgi:hypothetical protein
MPELDTYMKRTNPEDCVLSCMSDSSPDPLDDLDEFTSLKMELEEDDREFSLEPRVIEGHFPGEKSKAENEIQKLVEKARANNVEAVMEYVGESDVTMDGTPRHHIKIRIEGPKDSSQ